MGEERGGRREEDGRSRRRRERGEEEDEVARWMQNTSRQISLATSDEFDGVRWLDSLNLNLLLQSSNLKTPVSK